MNDLNHLLHQRATRLVILLGLLLASLALLAVVLWRSGTGQLAQLGVNDFTQYYAAARLLLQADNPYDPQQLLMAERAIGWLRLEPLLIWNPPWTLSLFLPFTLLRFDAARWAWLAGNILLAMLCGVLLWREFAGREDRRYWLAIVAAVTFMPTLQTLRVGQVSLFLLLGITGFLVAVRSKRDFLAGACLVLLTLKPHTALIFLAGVGWWVVRERRWMVLLGGALTLLATCAVVGAVSPAVFGQYLQAASSPPLYWRSATLGTWLRSAFGADQQWLQFLPSVVGIVMFVVWALRRKGKWKWPSLAPGLLLASAISALYGWGFDQVVLLPVVVVLFVKLRLLSNRQRFVLISLYLMMQLSLLVLNQYEVDAAYFYWHPVALAGLYGWQQGMINSDTRQYLDKVVLHDQVP